MEDDNSELTKKGLKVFTSSNCLNKLQASKNGKQRTDSRRLSPQSAHKVNVFGQFIYNPGRCLSSTGHTIIDLLLQSAAITPGDGGGEVWKRHTRQHLDEDAVQNKTL